MRHELVLGLAAALVFASPACRRDRPWPPAPAVVHLGEDACASCSMIISDERFAAQVQTRDGVVTAYDDLGCLFAKAGPLHPDPEGVFVRAFDGSGWLRGDQAVVVRSADIRSPMGHGFAAFASRDAALIEARAHADASVASLATLLHDGAPPPALMPAKDRALSTSQGVIHP